MQFIRKYLLLTLISLSLFGALYIFISQIPQEYPSKLYFTLYAKVEHKDIFQLFYKTKDREGFSEEQSIRTIVADEKGYQKIVFTLPVDLNINKIRLDLGNALYKTTEVVQIRYFSISNQTVTRYYSAKSLKSFFKPNYAELNDDGLVITKLYGTVYDPGLESDDISQVMDELKKPAAKFMAKDIVIALVFTLTLIFFIFNFKVFEIDSQVGLKMGFIIIFCSLLVTPLMVQVLGITSNPDNLEKRELAKMPAFEMSKAFAKQFELYYNDNFGLRASLIRIGSIGKVTIFNSPRDPDKVMIGKSNWLFYNDFNGNDFIFKSYTHLNTLKSDELISYVNVLEQRQQLCEKSNIIYIKGFWPQTHTIYHEYLPVLMKIQIKDTISKADQIINYLKKTNSALRFIDVRPALFAKAKEVQLYRKLDTHWNEYGAYIGYQSLLNQSYNVIGVVPKPIDDFTVFWTDDSSGDLVDMLGGTSIGFKDSLPSFTYKHDDPKIDILHPTPVVGYPDKTIITSCMNCLDKRKVIVFRDSYGTNIIPFLSLHFAEVYYFWCRYDQSLVDRVKSDIIFDVPVERYL